MRPALDAVCYTVSDRVRTNNTCLHQLSCARKLTASLFTTVQVWAEKTAEPAQWIYEPHRGKTKRVKMVLLGYGNPNRTLFLIFFPWIWEPYGGSKRVHLYTVPGQVF